LKNFSALSKDAQAWFDGMAAGWRWERHETEVLRRAAEALDRYWQAKAQLDKDGPTIRDRFGVLKTHPAHCVERDSRSAFLQAMRQLRFDDQESAPAGKLVAVADRQRRVRA
jgi:hypothetical protein